MYINIMKLRIDKQVTILFTALPIENYGMMPFLASRSMVLSDPFLAASSVFSSKLATSSPSLHAASPKAATAGSQKHQ